MKKIAVATVVLFLLGAATFVIFQTKKERQAKREGTLASASNQTIQGKLSDLLAQNTSMACSFSYADAQGQTTSSGDVYVANGQMRGDFETNMPTANPPITRTHMIKVEDVSYIWGMDGKNGYKMTITDEDVDKLQSYLPKAEQSTGSAARPTDQQDASYDCRAWSVDSTMFEPPSDIVFTDMSPMMDQIPTRLENDASPTTDACEACQMAPDEAARASCKKAMGCP